MNGIKRFDCRTDALLFFINREILFCHVNVKQLYRLFISLSSIGYVIYYARKDLLNCLIVPSGQVPLALMWGLHSKRSFVDKRDALLHRIVLYSSTSIGFDDLHSINDLLQLE